MQTTYGMNAREFAAQKQELRTRSHELSAKLDRYLAGEYGIEASIARRFDKWQADHQPFHWCAEFFGIMLRGGFDAIIGNPPYVEYRTVQSKYTIRGYRTESCGNLYAFTWERCLAISATTGQTAMIVPVASVCTDGYAPLQALLWKSGTSVIYPPNDRPSKLFDGLEHIRLCIIVHQKATTPWKDVLNYLQQMAVGRAATAFPEAVVYRND